MVTCTNSLADRLDEVLDLRPFPAVASQLISACNDPNSTARQLSEIIENDPGLSLKLLQVANSSAYGFSGEIRTVDHAAVILGIRALRNLAMSSAVTSTFASGGPETADARSSLWLHSLACGTIARSLANTLGVGVPEEAFLGGLVHDVGKLFFLDHQPDLYVEAMSETPFGNLVSVENDRFGLAHTFVGRKCGQNWGLPDEINDVICFHHAPEDADFHGDLINVVATANQLCHLWMNSDASSDVATVEILDAAGFSLTEKEVGTFHDETMSDVTSAGEAYC